MVYKIAFIMRSPIILNDDLHLDSILSAVHPAMHNRTFLTRASLASDVTTAPLPIDSAKLNGEWIWCASCGIFPDDAQYFHDKFSKRTAIGDFNYLHKSVTPGVGPGRDRCETIYGAVAAEVMFYASIPDKMHFENELCRLLKRVKYLGGMRKCGYGQIADFELEKTDEEWQDCLIRHGRAARILPVAMLDDYDDRDATRNRVNPPYWMPSGARECVKPGAYAVLKPEVWLNAAERR